MSDPQVWTLIGVFATSMFGALSLVVVLTNRATRTAIDGLRDVIDARFEAVDVKFDAVNARFDAVNAKLDHLDRDVTALMRREFGPLE